VVEIARFGQNSEDPEYEYGLTLWHARLRSLVLRGSLVRQVQAIGEYFGAARERQLRRGSRWGAQLESCVAIQNAVPMSKRGTASGRCRIKFDQAAREAAGSSHATPLLHFSYYRLRLTSCRNFDNYRNMKSTEVVKALGALAQESRLAVFRVLVKRGPEGFTPSILAEKLGIAAPTLSFHLKELQNAGLVAVRREGRFLFYSTRFDRMRELVGFLTDECCSQADVVCDQDCKPVVVQARRRA
jgi:ArsR family transcriptional regulator, arsenate/arsenite/antimonite-responsive transcriptional repressor